MNDSPTEDTAIGEVASRTAVAAGTSRQTRKTPSRKPVAPKNPHPVEAQQFRSGRDPFGRPITPGRINVELARRAGLRLRLVHTVFRATVRPGLDAVTVLGERGPLRGAPALGIARRAEVAAAVLRPARGTQRRPVRFADFRAEWLWYRGDPGPEAVGGTALLYFHGGAFTAGGLHSHRRLSARVARAAGAPLLNVDYRQLPDAHLTDAVDDAVTAYRFLLDRGFAPERIAFVGDSAGGGLTFAAALAVRDRGLPMPGAIAAIAPFADLDPARRRAHPNDRSDPVLSAHILDVPVRMGLARDGVLDPAWSPVNHDFTGLPPTLIQVGDTEVLLDDAEQLASRLAAAGVPHCLQIWDHALHVFQAGADVLPEARAAISDIGEFLRRTVEMEKSS